MRQRVGLFGGAFNPPHLAHLRAAKEVLEGMKLDRMFFMPSGNHPFKSPKQLLPAYHRLEMTRRIIKEESRFEVSDLETKRSGLSYTVDSLQQFGHHHEGEPFFLLGADLFEELHLWKSWQKLITLAHLVLLIRPGYESLIKKSLAAQFLKAYQVHEPDALDYQKSGRYGYFVFPMTPMDISSTDVRQLIQQKKKIDHLVPASVRAYIKTHHLYQ
ncbi:nicotinate (nicotinamide) nucleotide adenylyltransferase [Magnetococcales bacterium HHB-1]